MRAAVLGSPVAHSLSPALHRAGYLATGLGNWRYDAIDCDAAALPGLVGSAGPEWAGFSVTMPDKAAAAQVAGWRSARVERLGVANTLYRVSGQAGWAAENTDVDGVLGALRAAGLSRPGRVLMLGGGHTARAVVAALAEWPGGAPVSVVLAGRRPESIAACADLAVTFGLPVDRIGFTVTEVAAAADGADLVVSTVPGHGADPVADAVRVVPAVLDAVYSPWPTALAAAGTTGRVVVSGLDMLLHQAFRQFELFTGHPAPRSAMRDGLRAASRLELPLPV